MVIPLTVLAVAPSIGNAGDDSDGAGVSIDSAGGVSPINGDGRGSIDGTARSWGFLLSVPFGNLGIPPNIPHFQTLSTIY